MIITLKFDIGQTVFILIDMQIRECTINTFLKTTSSEEYGLKPIGMEYTGLYYRPEHKIYTSKQELIDNLLKDE